jgi:hypothetical protein
MKEGLCNFAVNIKSLMQKCADGKKLTLDERRTIVSFYLEVVRFLNTVEVPSSDGCDGDTLGGFH